MPRLQKANSHINTTNNQQVTRNNMIDRKIATTIKTTVARTTRTRDVVINGKGIASSIIATHIARTVAVSTHIKSEVVDNIRETTNTMKIIDTRIIVYPSVTEGRRWIRTLTKGTRAVRVATAKRNIKNQVWTSITNGSLTINSHTNDSTTKKDRTQLRDLT